MTKGHPSSREEHEEVRADPLRRVFGIVVGSRGRPGHDETGTIG